MTNRNKEILDSLQLKRWIQAVSNGQAPTFKCPETGGIITIPMPLARSDGDGLTFTLSPSGTASWILRYRHGGRSRELTIGNFPDISLSEARRLARERRAEIDCGGDPASEKRKSKSLASRDWTVRHLIDDYRKKILVDLSNSSQRSYGRSLKRIESKISSFAVSKITSFDIVTMLEETKTTWTESSMLLCACKMLFRHAAAKKLITVNPCAGIELKALLGKRPPIRRRLMLTEMELRQVLHAKMKRENALAIRLLLGTAVRSEELFNAKWSDVDFTQRVWSIPSSKTGSGIQIPLSTQVTGWLIELKSLSADSTYVLPSRTESRRNRFGGDAPINRNTIGGALEFWLNEHKPDIRRFTPHDLRSTAKSHMRALGIPRDITEMCLNHKLPGIEGIYDVHTYFAERKEALSLWGSFLARLEEPPTDSIYEMANPI